jgi:hypothetical protein
MLVIEPRTSYMLGMYARHVLLLSYIPSLHSAVSKIGLFVFLLLSCKSSLYIVHTNPLSDIWLAKNFSHSAFNLLLVSLFFYFFFWWGEGGTGLWTQSPTLTRQALYHLSYSARPGNIFWGKMVFKFHEVLLLIFSFAHILVSYLWNCCLIQDDKDVCLHFLLRNL